MAGPPRLITAISSDSSFNMGFQCHCYIPLQRFVHTNQLTATWCTYRWSFIIKGTGVRVYATIPNGTGTSVVDYSLSRGSSLRVWQTSGSKPIYGKEVFYSGLLPLGDHTLVMSNMGEDNDMDFELDRIVVELQGSSSTGAQTCKFLDPCF